MQKSLFFLRPFYVLSTSFLRNGYMEVRKVHKRYIFEGNTCIFWGEYIVYFFEMMPTISIYQIILVNTYRFMLAKSEKLSCTDIIPVVCVVWKTALAVIVFRCLDVSWCDVSWCDVSWCDVSWCDVTCVRVCAYARARLCIYTPEGGLKMAFFCVLRVFCISADIYFKSFTMLKNALLFVYFVILLYLCKRNGVAHHWRIYI